MFLDSLKIIDFRCFHSKEIEFGKKNILLGMNGTGKTSLLEAIHLFSLGRSFRSSDEQSLIRNSADNYFIRAQVSDRGTGMVLETAYTTKKQRQSKIDG